MKRFFILIVFIEFFYLCPLTYSKSENYRSTAVIGFINLGNENDSYFNTMLTKSFITTFETIPGSDITLYPEIEKVAIEQNFWKQKVFEKRIALQLGQKLLVKQVITGEYKKIKDGILLNIFIFDVTTEELLFKKGYKLSTSLDFFDNIDNIGKEILGFILGKNVEFGTLVFQLTNTSAQYTLYINGKNTFSFSNETSFKKQYLANERIEISLEKNSQEVLRKSILLKPDETFNILYYPLGNLIVKNLNKKRIEFLFENTNYSLGFDEKIVLREIKAGNYEANFKLGEKIEKRKFTIEEGDTYVLVFGLPEKKGYLKSWPLMNIILPGFAQIQGEDYLIGALFMVGGLTGLGFSILSISAYTISAEKYERAVTENDKTKFSRLKSEWAGYTILSLSCWATITISSLTHAFYMQKKETLSFYFLPERDGLTLNFALNF